MEEGVVLDGEGDALADVLAEPRVDGARIAAAHHEVDPTVGDMLEHREVLRDLDRIVGRDQRRRGRQDESLRLRGDVAEHRRGRRRHEWRIVVLPGREHVQTDFLGLERQSDHPLDPLGFRRRAAGDGIGGDITDREDPELHEAP